MIDYLAIGVTHLLLVLAAIRLLSRGDLDREVAPQPLSPAPAPIEQGVEPASGAPAGRTGVARLPRLGKGRRA